MDISQIVERNNQLLKKVAKNNSTTITNSVWQAISKFPTIEDMMEALLIIFAYTQYNEKIESDKFYINSILDMCIGTQQIEKPNTNTMGSNSNIKNIRKEIFKELEELSVKEKWFNNELKETELEKKIELELKKELNIISDNDRKHNYNQNEDIIDITEIRLNRIVDKINNLIYEIKLKFDGELDKYSYIKINVDDFIELALNEYCYTAEIDSLEKIYINLKYKWKENKDCTLVKKYLEECYNNILCIHRI